MNAAHGIRGDIECGLRGIFTEQAANQDAVHTQAGLGADVGSLMNFDATSENVWTLATDSR